MSRLAPQTVDPETRDFDPTHDRKVSAKVHKRLAIAHEVINDVKKVNAYAGNQREGLKLSKGNSAYRGSLLRDDVDSPNWTWSNDAAKELADNYPEAFHAAKAEVMGAVTAPGVKNPGAGGTCWDQATIAYYFLRIKAVGEPIAVVSSPIDHAFTHIGDHTKENHGEVAVCDAWPTSATACPWDEHFCHAPLGSSGDVSKGLHMIADGGGKAGNGVTDVKEAIKASLSLSPEARRFVQTTLTDAEVDRHLTSGMDRSREWPERVRPDQPVYHHWSNVTTTRPGEEIRSLDLEAPGGRYMTEQQIKDARGGSR